MQMRGVEAVEKALGNFHFVPYINVMFFYDGYSKSRIRGVTTSYRGMGMTGNPFTFT